MHTRHTYIAISNIDQGHPNDALVTIGIILIDFNFEQKIKENWSKLKYICIQ